MTNFFAKIFGSGAAATIDAVGNAIDKIDKSDEKLDLQLKYKQLLLDVEGKYLDYEGRLLDAQKEVITTEAKGESMLQRNWRPILMLVCIFIVLNNYVLVPYFQIPSAVLDDHIWKLIEIGTGGYIAGRSLEKITDKLAPALFNVKRQAK